MAERDRSNPYVTGLTYARANKAFHKAGSRPVGPEHLRKSSDSKQPPKKEGK